MKILALETSTECCSCALLTTEGTYERFAIAPRKHAELLLPMVDELLCEAEFSLSQLDAIAFGCGPGSFMGVRLATGVAQGLGFAANVALLPISSLQTLAQRAYSETKYRYLLAGWDARMGEIYWGAYIQNESGIMLPLEEEHISSPQEINISNHHPWKLVGNAWELYRSKLPAMLQLESLLVYPRALAMLQLAGYYLAEGGGVSAAKAQPNYLRQQVAFSKVPNKF